MHACFPAAGLEPRCGPLHLQAVPRLATSLQSAPRRASNVGGDASVRRGSMMGAELAQHLPAALPDFYSIISNDEDSTLKVQLEILVLIHH